MIEKRRCVGCEQEFPLTTGFYGTSKGYFLRRCKICVRLQNDLREIKKHRVRLREIQMPAARALRAAGYSPKCIADDLGVSEEAVVSFFERRAA